MESVPLLLVLLLCMTPTAGMFRWSFRWLPFFHLGSRHLRGGSFARLKPGSPTPAKAALGLLVLLGVAGLIFNTTGSYALPLSWILIGLGCGLGFIGILPA